MLPIRPASLLVACCSLSRPPYTAQPHRLIICQTDFNRFDLPKFDAKESGVSVVSLSPRRHSTLHWLLASGILICLLLAGQQLGGSSASAKATSQISQAKLGH